MIKLHSVMSTYNVETILGSLCVFHNGNTHNGLIFDPKRTLPQAFIIGVDIPFGGALSTLKGLILTVYCACCHCDKQKREPLIVSTFYIDNTYNVVGLSSGLIRGYDTPFNTT